MMSRPSDRWVYLLHSLALITYVFSHPQVNLPRLGALNLANVTTTLLNRPVSSTHLINPYFLTESSLRPAPALETKIVTGPQNRSAALVPDLPTHLALHSHSASTAAEGREPESVSQSIGNVTNALITPMNVKRLGQYPPKDPTCKSEPLIWQTWNKLELDHYIQEYEGGKNKNVAVFMREHGMSNFDCGMGKRCHAFQICYPINSKAWYIAYALQQWNTYYNIYYDAVGYGIAIVQSSINTLFASLFTTYDTAAIANMKANLGINAALSQVTGTVIMDIMLMCGQRVGPIGYVFNMINFAIAAAMGFGSFAIKEPPAPLKDGFDEWSHISWYLSEYEKTIHEKLDEQSQKVLLSGVSTDDGIYGLLKNGTFINPGKMISLPEVEGKIKNITMALSVNMILHRINAFVTIGTGCVEPGQNGAFPTGKRLSYCDKPGGTMYNIILSLDDKSVNELDNANVFEDNYGYSTEMIVMASVRCQGLGKGFNFVPWKDGHELPQDVDSPCVFNLPVCDTREHKIHKKIHKKIGGWTTAKACRKVGGLPLKVGK